MGSSDSCALDKLFRDVTFGFTTIDRRNIAFEAIRVVRREFPHNPLILVDQNEPTKEARDFYVEHDVTVHFVEHDVGLSVARNLIFNECKGDYLFLLDDDVVELPKEEMLKSFDVIRTDKRVLVVGGRSGKIVKTKNGVDSRIKNPPFFYFLFRRLDARFAIFFDPGLCKGIRPPSYDRHEAYIISDIVENFAIFDVPKYRRLGLCWDDEIKIVAEHIDFYLDVKDKTQGSEDSLIVANPRMVAYDIDLKSEGALEAYKKKRFRHEYRDIYAQKWNISAEVHIGKWININRETGFQTVRWNDLPSFGKQQMSLYRLEGDENIRRYGDYPIGKGRLSFIATTINRFDAIQALAISIRSYFGYSVDILIGVQCEQLPGGFEHFARQLRVTLVQMEYDVGLSAARNKLVATVGTDYFVLCDDDFIIDDKFHIGNALRVLDDEPEIAGVGGYYRDVIYDESMRLKGRVDRHFSYQMALDENTGTLIRVPFYHLPVGACYDRERGALPVDVIQNIAVFRTDFFGPQKLHWDDRMKISGEHIDFYVKNLLQDGRKFLFDPGLSVLHNRVHNVAYQRSRSRLDGAELFYEKWGIKCEVDTELGVRFPKSRRIGRAFSLGRWKNDFVKEG